MKIQILKSYIFLFFFLLYFNQTQAQKYLIVNLKQLKIDSSGLFFSNTISGVKVNGSQDFCNLSVPKNARLYKFCFDPDHESYLKYLSSKSTHEGYLEYIKFQHIDTSKLYSKNLRDVIYGLHYYDSIRKRGVLILDQNFNHDFSDDKPIYSYDSAGKDFPIIILRGIQIFDGKKVLQLPLVVRPFYSSTVTTEIDTVNGKVKRTIISDHPFSLDLYPYLRSTTLFIDSHKYRISIVSKRGLYTGYSALFPWFLKYYPLSTSPMKIKAPFLHKGDKLNLGRHIYTLDSVTYNGEKLFLRFDGYNNNNLGYVPGANAGVLSGNDILRRKVFSNKENKNKWILIDFWGTWCEPCRESIPKLRELNKEFKGKLQIISIACEKDVTPDSVCSFANKNGMKWIQFYEMLYNKDPHSFENRFVIFEFPTFILINPKGKICLRGAGEDYPLTLKKYLLKSLE